MADENIQKQMSREFTRLFCLKIKETCEVQTLRLSLTSVR